MNSMALQGTNTFRCTRGYFWKAPSSLCLNNSSETYRKSNKKWFSRKTVTPVRMIQRFELPGITLTSQSDFPIV